MGAGAFFVTMVKYYLGTIAVIGIIQFVFSAKKGEMRDFFKGFMYTAMVLGGFFWFAFLALIWPEY